MKLWLKLTCITLACTLVALSVCLGVFSVWQNDRIIDTVEEQAHASLRLFCSNLESLNNATPGSSVSDLTGRSIVRPRFYRTRRTAEQLRGSGGPLHQGNQKTLRVDFC